MILNRQVSVMDQAEFRSWPTFGTPPATVNPMEPGWYKGAFLRHTWLPTVMSLLLPEDVLVEVEPEDFALPEFLDEDVEAVVFVVAFFLLAYLSKSFFLWLNGKTPHQKMFPLFSSLTAV